MIYVIGALHFWVEVILLFMHGLTGSPWGNRCKVDK